MKKIKVMVFLGCLLLLSVSMNVCLAEGTGQISGTTSYVDGWGSYPLPFTCVSTAGLYDISNVYGEFCIDNVPFGLRTVTARRAGFETAYFDVEVTEENPFVHIDIILEEKEGDGVFSYVTVKTQSSIVFGQDVVVYEVHLKQI